MVGVPNLPTFDWRPRKHPISLFVMFHNISRFRGFLNRGFSMCTFKPRCILLTMHCFKMCSHHIILNNPLVKVVINCTKVVIN